VKDYGGSVSAYRTAEQTDVARFWTTHPTVQSTPLSSRSPYSGGSTRCRRPGCSRWGTWSTRMR